MADAVVSDNDITITAPRAPGVSAAHAEALKRLQDARAQVARLSAELEEQRAETEAAQARAADAERRAQGYTVAPVQNPRGGIMCRVCHTAVASKSDDAGAPRYPFCRFCGTRLRR